MVDPDTLKLVIPVITMVFGVGTFYGLIRADLRFIRENAARTDQEIDRVNATAAKAHERIDAHIERHHTKV